MSQAPALEPQPQRSEDFDARRKQIDLADLRFVEGIDYLTLPEQEIAWEELSDDVRLEAEQEVELFRQYNLAKYRAHALRAELDEQRGGTADPQAVLEEVERLVWRAWQLRNRLACVYHKLAISIARHFVNRRHDLDDLSSESELTLLRAVDNFNPEFGFRFSTYATHALRRRLMRYLQTERTRSQRQMTVDNPLTVTDDNRWTPAYQRRIERQMEMAETLLRELPPRERYIVRARFGWGMEFEPRTLQEIADELELSRERVRQLEKRALLKLNRLAEEQETG